MGALEVKNWMAQVDIFVDPDGSETNQAASLVAVSKLLMGRKIIIQDIVTGMGKYLTTTDNSIRARAIILLGELLVKLSMTPLEDTTIHSLATFFTSKLADWHCLRGALIGAIALLRRSRQVGRVEESDVQEMAKSILQYLHVQALGFNDRLLSLELFECLVNTHGASVSSMGGDWVYGVCAAIEGEKDPRCLLVAFHLVERLALLFPASDVPLADFAEDLFDIVSRYFPVSFSPPPNDTLGISRDDLADALLKVFTSTPSFAPFCIPFLLEKLSSSLQRAKLDSLRYLGLCALSFGLKSISEHVGAIWLALKAELIPLAHDEKDAQIHDGALICLTRCVEAFQKGVEEGESQVTADPLTLICVDDSVDDLLRFVENDLARDSELNNASDSSVMKEKAKFEPESNVLSKRANAQTRATGQMLAAVVKASPSSCCIVTEKILNRLISAAGLSSLGQIETTLVHTTVAPDSHQSSGKGSLSVLGLEVIIQILAGAAKVAERLAPLSTSSTSVSAESITMEWLEPISSVAPKLLMGFSQVTLGQVLTENHSKLGVAGLQALASFPASYSPLTEEELQQLLSTLLSTLLDDTNASDLKDSALEAILTTSNLEGKFRPVRGNGESIVVNMVTPKLLEAVQHAETTATLDVPLQALAAIAGTRQIAREAVLLGLQQIVAAQFPLVVAASDTAWQRMAALLECLSKEIIPFCEKGSTDQLIACHIVLDIWILCQSLSHTTNQLSDEVLSSIMTVNRVTVRSCLEEAQEKILSRGTSVLLDWDNSNTLENSAMEQDGVQDRILCTTTKFTGGRGWLVALVASIVVGSSPAAVLTKRKLLLSIFVETSISEVSALIADVTAQATASLINKWKDTLPGIGNAEDRNDTVVEAIREAVDETVMPVINEYFRDHQSTANITDPGVHKERDKGQVVRAVFALGWIGKGLAMRGHERVPAIVATLLALLQLEGMKVAFIDEGVGKLESPNLDSVVAQAAAKSIGIIVKDDATCLDRAHNAVVRPLFKQRFFTSMLPPLQEAVRRAGNASYRIWFYRAFGHLLSGTPRTAVLTEGQKVFPLVLEGLSALCNHVEDSELLLSSLLTLSSFLTDENYGRNIAADYVPAIVKRLTTLVLYRASLVIRETALQCLGAIVGLPFAQVYPEKPQVMKALNAALDDHKRRVRKEAVRCLRVWSAISS